MVAIGAKSKTPSDPSKKRDVSLLSMLAIFLLGVTAEKLNNQSAQALFSTTRRMTTTTTTTTTVAADAAPPATQSTASKSGVAISTADLAQVRATYASLTFAELEPLARRWSMVIPRMFAFAVDAIKQVDAKGIEGDIVECGVWRGGMTMAMMFQSIQGGNLDRDYWLFDTFEGLPEPTDPRNGPRAQSLFRDITASNTSNPEAGQLMKSRAVLDGKFCYAPYHVVQHNVAYTAYPPDQIHMIRGKVEDTLQVPANLPEKIAVLRLDTDWYESTKAELEILYSRLQPGGLLIIDDYCAWDGAHNAAKEFFRDTLNIDAEELKDQQQKHGTCLHYWKP